MTAEDVTATLNLDLDRDGAGATNTTRWNHTWSTTKSRWKTRCAHTEPIIWSVSRWSRASALSRWRPTICRMAC